MKRNEGLQVLRGLCCLGILFAHSFAYAEWTWNLDFGAFPGRMGMLDYVTFFFFLTGYLVAAQIKMGGGTSKSYIKSRFWGLYPAYWFALSVVTLLSLIVFNRIEVSYDFWKSILLLPGEHTFLCTVEWTLQYQVIFYLFAFLFFFKHTRKFFPLGILAGIVSCVLYKVGLITVPNDIVGMLFSRDSMLTMYVGALTFYVADYFERKVDFDEKKRGKKKLLPWMLLITVLSFIAATFALDHNLFVLDKQWKYIVVYGLVILAFFCFYNYHPTERNIIKKIGDQSYIIYLLHPTLINSFFHLFSIRFKYNVAIQVIAVFLSLVIAYFLSKVSKVMIKAIRVELSNRKILNISQIRK